MIEELLSCRWSTFHSCLNSTSVHVFQFMSVSLSWSTVLLRQEYIYIILDANQAFEYHITRFQYYYPKFICNNSSVDFITFLLFLSYVHNIYVYMFVLIMFTVIFMCINRTLQYLGRVTYTRCGVKVRAKLCSLETKQHNIDVCNLLTLLEVSNAYMN